jgi:hypothetical protein
MQPLCHLSAVYFQQLSTEPAIHWWLNGGLTGEKGTKPSSAWPWDNPVVTKPQFQLQSIFFRLSQFFDPCLYLPYCVKHGTIEDLNIAFSGDVRFRVTQDTLYDFVLAPIAYRFDASPRRNACQPYHGKWMASSAR